MRVPRLFVDSPLHVDTVLVLADSRAHYLKHVLRLKTGGRVTLFNGEGGEYAGTITEKGRQRVEVHIDAFADADRESPLVVRLGLGIMKQAAMDTAMRKATELGTTEITPVITEFTDIPRKALSARHDHWLQIVRSACEQCERNRPPHLNHTVSLDAWLGEIRADAKYVAHPGSGKSLDDFAGKPGDVALLTGPEGGFSSPEIDLCIASGFEAVELGPRILRADTAPVVLLTLIQAKFGDLAA